LGKSSAQWQNLSRRNAGTNFDEIGGLGTQIERVKRALNLHVFHAETASYGLRRRVRFCWSTFRPENMIAKALANWLATLSPGGARGS
jgi:hypothetical protein